MDGEMAATAQSRPLCSFASINYSGPQASTSGALTWIQCKLGQQYFVKESSIKFLLPLSGGIRNLIRFSYFAQSKRLKIWQKRKLIKVDNNRQWRTKVDRRYLTDIYQYQDECTQVDR